MKYLCNLSDVITDKMQATQKVKASYINQSHRGCQTMTLLRSNGKMADRLTISRSEGSSYMPVYKSIILEHGDDVDLFNNHDPMQPDKFVTNHDTATTSEVAAPLPPAK